MLQIDDSGWGSLIGGTLIGMYNTNNAKFISRLIPIKYFQGSLFSSGKYRNKACSIVQDNIHKLGEVDHIIVCRGTCLDTIYEYLLSTNEYNVVERKEIKDPLQSLLEDQFAKHLKKCGVPQRTDGAHCLSFDDQLKWVYEDLKRVKYIKTGWHSWKTKYSRPLL